MTLSLSVWFFVIGLLGSLIFSTLSYALRTMSRVKMEDALNRFRRQHALDAILSAQFDLALTASILRLVANTAVILAVAWHFLARNPTSPHPFVIFGFTLLIAIPSLIIVSVVIPQAWSKYAGELLLAFTWPLLHVIHVILWPLISVLSVFDELVRRLAGVSISEDPTTAADAVQQEILSVVAEGASDGTVDEEQKKMIEGVISFRDLQVGQIMTPRTEIIACDVTTPVLEIRDKILKEGISRIPLFENSLDVVVGILYAKDLLALIGLSETSPLNIKVELRKIMRPPLFVPRTKPLRDLLREFRHQQIHMAVVLDEYGGTSGLVTTEDIIEQIIGDIADEYERPQPEELKHVGDNTVEVDARMNIAELNRALSLELPEDADFQTIGGFVISTLGAIPAKNDHLTHKGLLITVLDAEPRRIKKLRLKLPERHEPQSSQEPATAA